MTRISPLKGDAFRAGYPKEVNVVVADAGDDQIEDTNHLSKRSASYLLESSSAPLSPSQNRNQGFPLSNSKTQLLRLNNLYEDNEDESLNRSLDRSRDYSADFSHPDASREDGEFHVNLIETTTSPNRTPISPLYQTFSTSSTESSSGIEHDPDDENDSEFLIEARKSLKAIREWDHIMTFSSDDDGNSSCDASCNSSYDGNLDVKRSFDSQSACDNDDIRERHPSKPDDNNNNTQSCPDLHERGESGGFHQPTNTKAWLQEIQNDDFEQRNRIALLIAEKSRDSSTSHTPKFLRRIGSGGMLRSSSKGSHGTKRSSSNFFRSREKMEHDRKNDSWNEKPVKERQRLKKQRLMRSILLSRRSWQGPTPFRKNQRKSKSKLLEEDHEIKSDNRPSGMHAANKTATPVSDNPSDQPSEKELQLKRTMLGNTRVVTMDGIVESFSDTAPTPSVSEYGSLHKRVRETGNLAPTSDAPLTWV